MMIVAPMTREQLLAADASFAVAEIRRQPGRWKNIGAAIDFLRSLDFPRKARETPGYRDDLLSLVAIGLCDPLTADDRAAISSDVQS